MFRMWLPALLLSSLPVCAQTLHVYGPGGPLAPMRECASLYSRQSRIVVLVVGGTETQWIGKAQADADIIYGGAEYMLTEFGLKHPGFLAPGTRSELYPRAVGILVRKGNPKHIARLADLAQPGVAILDVNGAGQLGLWEDLAGRDHLLAPLQQQIAVSVENSGEAVRLWGANQKLDAWITYESWQKLMPETTDFVPFPADKVISRGTPIAIAARSQQATAAQDFITFLHSPQAHAVFAKWGWQ